MAMPSPITCIQWWRICLDEAQMIESTRAKTAEMALRLSAVNKWCVTGKQHICYFKTFSILQKKSSQICICMVPMQWGKSVLQKEINLPQNI